MPTIQPTLHLSIALAICVYKCTHGRCVFQDKAMLTAQMKGEHGILAMQLCEGVVAQVKPSFLRIADTGH